MVTMWHALITNVLRDFLLFNLTSTSSGIRACHIAMKQMRIHFLNEANALPTSENIMKI